MSPAFTEDAHLDPVTDAQDRNELVQTHSEDPHPRAAQRYRDSAGRHYSRESWERAQEGRSLGGKHSHSSNACNSSGRARRR